MPELGQVGQRQHGDQRHAEQLDGADDDQDRLLRHPIGDHAGEQGREHHADRTRGRHDGQLGGAAAQPDDLPHQGDQPDPGGEHVERQRARQPPVARRVERPERPLQGATPRLAADGGDDLLGEGVGHGGAPAGGWPPVCRSRPNRVDSNSLRGTSSRGAGDTGAMSEQKAPMPTAEGLAEPLRSRWSPSVFDDEHELDDDQLETLLRAAQWAPSWGNSQPWRFFVARRGDTTHGVLVEHLSRGNSTWVPRAAVVLHHGHPAATGRGRRGRGRARRLRPRAGRRAHHPAGRGRWACTRTSSRASTAPAVAARLGVPPHYEVMSGIAIGRRGAPDDVDERTRGREDRVRRRKQLAEFVYADSWGTPWRAP